MSKAHTSAAAAKCPKAAQSAPRAPASEPAAAAPEALGNRALVQLLQARSAGHDEGASERAADEAARLAFLHPPAAAIASQASLGPAPRHGLPGHAQRALAGRGEALPQALASQLSPAFGLDMGGVRVHRGPAASQSAAALGAQAYAYGRDIVVGAKHWQPHTDAGRSLIAHEAAHVAQQRWSAPRLQLKKAPAETVPMLEVSGATFEEAADNFAKLLLQQGETATARIVIVNGPNIKVFDEAGKAVSKNFFHLQAPAAVPIGVYRSVKGRAYLQPVIVNPNGSYSMGRLTMSDTINFGKDIDDQEGFNKALEGARYIYYVSPSSTAVPETADQPAPVPIENLPEFMQFEAKTKSNLPAWPSATLPLTPQLATVNSTGSFICKVDKNQGVNTLDRVTNLMQTTRFRWEVLKLDEKLRVKGEKTTTGWDAAVEGFARRKRQLADDRKAMRGDTKRQSIPESVFRAALDEQTAQTRETLAMVGQTVMTVINAITGGPNQLSTEDVMDVPFHEQGDFFVRCLATQVVDKDAKYKRATSVSGVMVSVFDIEDVAREALLSGSDLSSEADKSAAQIQAELDELDEDIKNGVGDVVIKRSERAYKVLTLDYYRDLSAAGGNPLNAKVAEQTLLGSQLAYFDSDEFPSDEKYRDFKKAKVDQISKRLEQVKAEVARMRGTLSERDSAIEPVGYMRGMLVDEETSAKTPLTFSVGERRYIAAGNLEVVIADVTGSKGRTFTGTGDGALGEGRQDAWLNAMTDLRQNLKRGRGWISYEVPGPYLKWKDELPNPMKLEMSASAQVKETIDDAAHALTVAAILAAPFTGGASLSILAVLAPIQAASSLYNIVNRAAYSDLELDQEAVFDLINVGTLGLGKLSTVGKVGSRGLEIVAASSKIAIRLLNAGQFIVISYETYNTLMEEGDPNADPREIKRKKLLKLLSWCEQAAIPISEKLFAEAHGPGAQRNKTASGKDPAQVYEAPTETIQGSRRKPSIEEGKLLEPHATAPKKAPVDATPEHPTEGIKPAPADAQPAAAEPVAFKPTKAQMRGVPEHLQGKVAVVEGMGKDAKIVYKRGANGLITDVQIQIGEKASAADVKTHAAVAELMLKYSGVGGRVRQLLGRFIDLFASPEAKRPEIGSRAWESKFELIKLDRLMRERHAELASIADQPADKRDATRQRELMSDLDSLELQYQEHADTYNAIEMGTAQGRGYVAAEDLAEGERVRVERGLKEAPDGYRWRFRKGELEVIADPGKPKLLYDETKKDFVVDTGARVPERFDAGVTKRQAFRELGGYDPKSSFGAFVDMLMKQELISSRQEVIDAMGDPSSRTHDTVRGNVKEIFRKQLVDQITSTKYLKKNTTQYQEVLDAGGSAQIARRAASMAELVRLSAGLDSADRGSLGERVYEELYGTKKSVTQVDVSPAELAAAKGVPEADIPKGRRIDRMDGSKAREIKNVSSRMGAEQRGEIDDMLAMIGSKVQPKTGPPRLLESVAVAFLDPLGGKTNASLALEILEANPTADLTFEFHTREGKVLNITYKNRALLQAAGFAASLGLP